MIAPSSTIATLRPDLGGAMREFDLLADRMGFIGHRILPILPVALKGDSWAKITLESLLQNRDTARAPGAGYSRGTWKFEPDTYACTEHGAEEPVDDSLVRMYRHLFDAEQIARDRALDVVLRNRERRIADLLFNATTWTGSDLTTGISNEWDKNHITDAVPIADVRAACDKVWSLTGLDPNALIINRDVFRNLRILDDITEKIASTGAGESIVPGKITAQQLAECFDLDYVLVAGGAKNTANEAQAAAIARIWSSEYAMVARVATTQDIQEPCLGRIFHWTEDSEEDGLVESYRDEPIRSDVVRVRNQTHEKTLYVQAAHLLSNVTTL